MKRTGRRFLLGANFTGVIASAAWTPSSKSLTSFSSSMGQACRFKQRWRILLGPPYFFISRQLTHSRQSSWRQTSHFPHPRTLLPFPAIFFELLEDTIISVIIDLQGEALFQSFILEGKISFFLHLRGDLLVPSFAPVRSTLTNFSDLWFTLNESLISSTDFSADFASASDSNMISA